MLRVLSAPIDLVRTLVAHRYLCAQLTRRFFAARHAGSSLGWLWTLGSTAIQFALFLVIFAKVLGMRVAGPPGVNFGVYLMTGLVPFLALSDALTRAAGVFRDNAALVQKVRFPAEVLVVSDTFGALGHQALALGIVVVVCFVLVHQTLAAIGWLVAGIVLLVAWSIGLALIVSAVGALLPDLREALALLLQVVFYSAPIVYPLEMVRNPLLRTVVQSNPLSGLVEVIRAGLIGGTPPSPTLTAVLCVGAFLLITLGAASLARLRPRLPDML